MEFKFEVGQRVVLAELAPLIEAGTRGTVKARHTIKGAPEYVIVLDDSEDSTIEAFYYPEADLEAEDAS